MALSTDPIDWLLNPTTGDITFPLSYSRGIVAVVQACRIAMSTFAGEWFLDLDQGVPFFERVGVDAQHAIFAQKYDPAKAIRAFRTVLAAVPSVTSITRLDVAFNGQTRTLTVTWSVKTTFGDTPVDTLALAA